MFPLKSLIGTIKQVRPELLPDQTTAGLPIPEDMPPNYLNHMLSRTFEIEDLGEPMTACFMTQTNTNPIGWYLLPYFVILCVAFLMVCPNKVGV